MYDLDEVLAEPHWYLDGFDAGTASFRFIEVELQKLQAAAFHDGRTPLAAPSGRSCRVSLAEALGREEESPGTQRIIAHTSFCGSTLLTRLLGACDGVLCHREPRVLIDLANGKSTGAVDTGNTGTWPRLLRFALAQLNKAWPNHPATCIKPSNWSNPILEDFHAAGIEARFVLMRAPVQDYLLANIRGGNDRIRYSIELLNHLARLHPALSSRAADIQATDLPPMRKVLTLLALCHQTQLAGLRMLEQHAPHCLWLEPSQLLGDPYASVAAAARTLELAIDVGHAHSDLDAVLQRDAKSGTEEVFSITREEAENRRLLAEYGADISAACDYVAGAPTTLA